MIDVIEYDKENNYVRYRSKYIVDNIEEIKLHCLMAHDRFRTIFPDKDSTWMYTHYNIFTLTSTSLHFYNMYKDLIFCAKDYLSKQNIDSNEPLWIQSWMNFHKPKEVLDWHNHYWPYHGYMSIDPKKTRTSFEDYSIDNEVGVLYFGEGYKSHKVEVLEDFSGERITIGYDFTRNINEVSNIGLIPVL
jgi:hypothetical protein